MLSLLQLNKGENGIITQFIGGRGFHQRMNQMGFHLGDTVQLIEKGAFGGPVMVKIHGSEFALGRGIAAKVLLRKDQ